MTDYWYEHELQEYFRHVIERDRQLTHRGWFRRHEHRPPKNAWRSRMGKALIRLGRWLEGRERVQLTRTPGEP